MSLHRQGQNSPDYYADEIVYYPDNKLDEFIDWFRQQIAKGVRAQISYEPQSACTNCGKPVPHGWPYWETSWKLPGEPKVRVNCCSPECFKENLEVEVARWG